MKIKFERFSDFESLKSSKSTIKSKKRNGQSPNDEMKEFAALLQRFKSGKPVKATR